MNKSLLALAATCTLGSALVGCGGGEDVATPVASSAGAQRESALAITGQQRAAAAARTAKSTTNECAAIQPFYWEIGSSSAKLTGGTVSSATDPTNYTASTVVDLGSASKWLYSAYIAQRRAGVLTEMDLKHLSLRSGYANLTQCYPNQTVNGCMFYQDNELFEASSEGKFDYNGAHMQKHASNIGLGPLLRQDLATEIKSQLGPQLGLRYDVALLSGGGAASANTYAAFLRKMMSGTLQMGSMLGINPICTDPLTCPGEVVKTPIPAGESWHYSVGHWIEDDPILGDGSFSSPGTKGFYPWIDANKTIYGLVSRQGDPGETFRSVNCGRLIRKAWKTGIAQ